MWFGAVTGVFYLPVSHIQQVKDWSESVDKLQDQLGNSRGEARELIGIALLLCAC